MIFVICSKFVSGEIMPRYFIKGIFLVCWGIVSQFLCILLKCTKMLLQLYQAEVLGFFPLGLMLCGMTGEVFY